MTASSQAAFLKRKAEGFSKTHRYASTGHAILEWAVLQPAEAMGFTHYWVTTTQQAPHATHGTVIRAKLIDMLEEDYPLAAAAARKICDRTAVRPPVVEPTIETHRLEGAAYSLIDRAHRMARTGLSKPDVTDVWARDLERLNNANSELGRDVAMAARVIAALTGTAGSKIDTIAQAALDAPKNSSQHHWAAGKTGLHPCKPRLLSPP